MAQLAEVLRAQAVQRGAVELGGTADAVMDLGRKLLTVLIAPCIGRHVAIPDEHLVGRDVLWLARQPAPAFDHQDAFARRRQVSRERAPAGAGADDDHVVMGHDPSHGSCQRPMPASS